MLELNDDCLYLIFCFFDLQEQLILTDVCTRFRWIIVNLIWKSKFNCIHTSNNDLDCLSKTQFQKFFELIAPHILRLTIDTKNISFSSYLGRYAKRPEFLFYLSFDFPNLRKLQVSEHGLHDSYIRSLVKRCPNLEVLKISSTYITGNYIQDLVHLRELFIPHCSISTSKLNEILKSLTLTHLDLTTNALNAKVITENLHSTRYLKELTISIEQLEDAKFFDNVDKLTSLKILCIRYEKHQLIADDFKLNWSDFFNKMGKKIKKLKISNLNEAINHFNFSSQLEFLRNVENFYMTADTNFPPSFLWPYLKLSTLRTFHFCIFGLQRRDAFAFFKLIENSKELYKVVFLSCVFENIDFEQWTLALIKVLARSRESNGTQMTLYVDENAFGVSPDSQLVLKRVSETKEYLNQHLLKIEKFKSDYSSYHRVYMEFGFS